MGKTTEDPESIDFEATLEELEALVEKMESGELTLDQSLEAFERGVTLTREAQQALKDAELRVKLLTEGENGLRLEDVTDELGDTLDDD